MVVGLMTRGVGSTAGVVEVLHAFGTPVAEDLWGIIKIHTLLRADGSMKRVGEGEKTSTFGT